jgi:hypothetical protein
VPGQARAGSSVGDVPQPDAAPLPLRVTPFETHRGSHLGGFRCRGRYQPIGGCPRRIRSAVWFRARCCLRATSLGRTARSPHCCATRCVAAAVAIMLWEGGRKAPLNQCCGGVSAPWGGPVKRELVRSGRLPPLFDTAKMQRDRVKAMGTTDDGGSGGLHNSLGALLVGRRSDAANTVARGTRHPSLASHTDISDRHITVFSWSMVGGLEVGLALRLRRLLSGVPRRRAGQPDPWQECAGCSGRAAHP